MNTIVLGMIADIEESINNSATCVLRGNQSIDCNEFAAMTHLQCENTIKSIQKQAGSNVYNDQLSVEALRSDCLLSSRGVYFFSMELIADLLLIKPKIDAITHFGLKWSCNKSVEINKRSTRIVELTCLHQMVTCKRCKLPSSFGLDGQRPLQCSELGGPCSGALSPSLTKNCNVQCTIVMNSSALIAGLYLNNDHHKDLLETKF